MASPTWDPNAEKAIRFAKKEEETAPYPWKTSPTGEGSHSEITVFELINASDDKECSEFIEALKKQDYTASISCL